MKLPPFSMNDRIAGTPVLLPLWGSVATEKHS